ncbi:MAG: Chain length determinant protein [Ferruginibacter sp.]|nr:Chain length determinant protein [Ferruginibacter sp.]
MPKDEITLNQLIYKLKVWLAYLLTRWQIVLLCGLVGGALGITYSIISKPIYTASLSFALEDQQATGLSGAMGFASQFGFDIGGTGGGMFAGANLIELFKSRIMVEKTLLQPINIGSKTISYAEMFIESTNWRKQWGENTTLKNLQFPPNADRQKFTRVQDSLLGAIYETVSKNSLNVEQKNKRVDIITVEMKSGNEYFAKYFTEALAQQVSDFYVQTKSKKARLNMDILERQSDSVRRELNGAITGVAIANDNTFALNPALNVRRAPSAHRQVDVQANSAILTELVKQTEMAKITVRKETPLIQVIDTPIFPLKKEKLGKLKGLILGGFLGGFLAILFLLLKRLLV